jgi:hypothetical protein
MGISDDTPMDKGDNAHPAHPRVMMAITRLVIGVLSGLVPGLFTFVASRVVKKSLPSP